MPNTTNGLPYPARTGVAPDVQDHIKKLAEAVDPTIAIAATAKATADAAALALADSGWVTLTVGSSWGAAAPAPAVRKIGKQVFLQGEVYNGSTGSANVIFTLPTGYRPPRRLGLDISKYHGSNGAVATLCINTDGTCFIVPVTGTAPTSSPGYVLNSCTWLVD